MTNVVELVIDNKVPHSDKSKPISEVITLLEGLLERAMTGELRAVGIIAATRNNGLLTGACFNADEGYRMQMLAGCSILSNRVMK